MLENPNTSEYWRIYYKQQELLASTRLEEFTSGADGGVREQSTLPPKLNAEAHKLALEIYNNNTKG